MLQIQTQFQKCLCVLPVYLMQTFYISHKHCTVQCAKGKIVNELLLLHIAIATKSFIHFILSLVKLLFTILKNTENICTVFWFF